MNIGNKIVELRKKNNLTQENLSKKIGVARQTLSSWESNVTSPNLEQAVLLSKKLRINLDELVDNELDMVVKDKTKNSILINLIGKNCVLELDDYCFDVNIAYNTIVKVLDVNDDFIKIEYKKNKQICHKLIDVNLIVSVKVMENE